MSENLQPLSDQQAAQLAALNLMEDAIAARKQAEAAATALQISEERMQQALRVSRSFTFDWDAATDKVVRSASCETILADPGAAPRFTTGEQFVARIHPDDRTRYVQMFKELTEAVDTYTIEYRFGRTDGSVVVLEETGRGIFDVAGKLARLVGITTDITARKRAEEALDELTASLEQLVAERTAALRESEEQFRVLFEHAQEGILLADIGTHRFLLANPQIQKWLGYSEADLLAMSVSGIHPAADLPWIIADFERQSRGETTTANNLPVRRKDGTVFYADVSTARLTLQGRQCLLGTFRDITERRQLETEIQRISEAERQRLGRELHDGLSQQLAGLRYLAGAVEAALTKQGVPEAADLAKIVRELESAGRQTHDLAQGLLPVDLQRGGLVPALQELAATISNLFKIKCWVVAAHDIPLADPDAARQLYRIAQEALINAAKHSQGKHVAIRLVEEPGRVILTVHDDGVGITKLAKAPTGLGLRIMQYRAAIINAELTIAPAPTGGTLVTCSLAADPAPAGQA